MEHIPNSKSNNAKMNTAMSNTHQSSVVSVSVDISNSEGPIMHMSFEEPSWAKAGFACHRHQCASGKDKLRSTPFHFKLLGRVEKPPKKYKVFPYVIFNRDPFAKKVKSMDELHSDYGLILLAALLWLIVTRCPCLDA